MKRRIMLFGLFFAASAALAFSQSNSVFVQFRPGRAKGALYKPDQGPAPHVGIIVTHRTGNTMAGLPNVELAKRGFMVLGFNSRFENNEATSNKRALDREDPGLFRMGSMLTLTPRRPPDPGLFCLCARNASRWTRRPLRIDGETWPA